MPKIILKFEAAVIKEYPFLSSTLTIGREPDNDIPIDHPAVSRHHCRVILQGNTYFVEDLNSTNGTMLNEKKIIKAGIHHMDVLSIAKHSLTFIDDRPESEKTEAPQNPVTAESIAQAEDQNISPPAEPAVLPIPQAWLDKPGGLRVVEGVVDEVEYTLGDTSVYIGKSDRVAIKIKGMFAPEVAAMITKKQDGYVIVAIKEGFPKVNGMPVQSERLLSEGDLLEVGSTKFQFYLKKS